MELTEVDPLGRWSQLLLPDTELLLDFNETTAPSPSQPAPAGAFPALPSPVRREAPRETPKLPQSFESELMSSRTAYRLHRRVQRGSHGEVWRAVRRDDTSGGRLPA